MRKRGMRGMVIAGLVALCATSCSAEDVFGAANMQGGSVFGTRETLRYSIATSDFIVVGRIIGDRETDADGGRFRVREIRVERSLYGTAEPGDTLRVAQYLSEATVFGQRDVYFSLPERSRFLYPLTRLERRDKVFPNGWLGVAFRNKLSLDDSDPEFLWGRNWLEWIRHPADKSYRDFLLRREASGQPVIVSSSAVDSDVAQQKLDSVATLIEEELARREGENGTNGRSN